MSNYREILEGYLHGLDIKADRVLDVGGAAKPVKDRVKSWEVGEYKIADSGLEQGKSDFPLDLNTLFGDPESGCIKWPGVESPREYAYWDIIFCLEVFEYLEMPGDVLEYFRNILKPTGLLCASFPFIYPVHEPRSNDYMRYTRQGVTKLLTDAGFSIIQMIDRNMKPESYALWQSFVRSEGMHPSREWGHHQSLGVIVKAQKL